MELHNSTHEPRSVHAKPTNSSLFDISRGVFWQAHPTTVRMLLALASMGWALVLLANYDILNHYPYQYMLTVMPAWAWCIGFMAHFTGTFWRIFDSTPRVHWALTINALGCFLWIALTICINMRAGTFLPGSSLDAVTCAFSLWVLIRTGLGKDVGTP